MTQFLIYDLKVSALLIVFYMGYRLLLHDKPFPSLSRIVLLTAALLSVVLPLCVITLHQTVVVEDAPLDLLASTGAARRAMPGMEEAPGWWAQAWLQQALCCLLATGTVLRLLFVGRSLLRLRRYIARTERHREPGGVTIAITDDHTAPFSWMHTIVLSRRDYEAADAAMMAHERAHVSLHHSFDVLMMEFLTALQWFNPALWLLRADLRSIHEYEADAAVIAGGADIRSYVGLLLDKAQAANGHRLANSMNSGALKQRIIMMCNKNQSRYSWLRALYLLPVAMIALAVSAETIVEYEYRPSAAEMTILKPQQPKKQVKKPQTKGKIRNVRITRAQQKPLYVVNGNIMEGFIETNAGDEILNVTVIKDSKKAQELYGPKAAAGVIIINTKQAEGKETTERKPAMAVKYTANDKQEGKPLFVVNGKVVDDILQIDEQHIDHVNVLKGEAATIKWGERGKNGVIEIIMEDKAPKEKVEKKQ